MQAVYKYVMGNEVATIELPIGAKIIHLAEQHGQTCMWVQVDTEAEKEKRYFVLYGTGHPMLNAEHTFIGTMLTAGGNLVWHVFELPNGLPKEPYRNEH